ncbi:MAG: hypothetical protein LBC04_02320 [Holosporaceae bacterium]|jgi:hypothetical protein|nr:hypothetical protein [Holosporaceae bacterium]
MKHIFSLFVVLFLSNVVAMNRMSNVINCLSENERDMYYCIIRGCQPELNESNIAALKSIKTKIPTVTVTVDVILSKHMIITGRLTEAKEQLKLILKKEDGWETVHYFMDDYDTFRLKRNAQNRNRIAEKFVQKFSSQI